MTVLGLLGAALALTIGVLAAHEVRMHAQFRRDSDAEPYPPSRLRRRLGIAALLEAVVALAACAKWADARLTNEAELGIWCVCLAMTLGVLLLARRDLRESTQTARGHAEQAAEDAMARVHIAMEAAKEAERMGKPERPD